MMSKFSDAIKKAIDAFGKDIIKDPKAISILADFRAFDETPAIKHVLSTIINGNFSVHLLQDNNQAQLLKDITEITNDYGFKEDIVREVYIVIVDTLQLPISIPVKHHAQPIPQASIVFKKYDRYKAICESYSYKSWENEEYNKAPNGVFYSKDKKALVYLNGYSASSLTIEDGTLYVAKKWYKKEEGNIKEIVIPTTIKAIGGWAFSEINLMKVMIPGNVKYIGDSAFYGNKNLSEVIISEGVEYIGESAFSGTNVKSVTLPSTLCYIGGNAFPSKTNVINNSIHLKFVNGIIYNNDCSILYSDFSQKEVIMLSDSVQEIGNSAFYDSSNLKEVILCDSVEKIGNSAFPDGLEKIVFGNSVKEIGEYAFCGCKKITQIVLPSTLETIGYSAFSDCESLESINIPKNVKKIGIGVFSGCTLLSEIYCESPFFEVEKDALYEKAQNKLVAYFGIEKEFIVRQGTELIEEEAFMGNANIEVLTIPKSVREIRDHAFFFCKNLRYVYVENPNCEIDSDACGLDSDALIIRK